MFDCAMAEFLRMAPAPLPADCLISQGVMGGAGVASAFNILSMI